MSLAPAEQRALNTIEDALIRSDRRLARMLTRFKAPLSCGRLVALIPRPRRLRRLIVSAVAVAAAAWLVVAVIRSPATPICSAPVSTGSVAVAHTGQCSLLMHQRHAASP